MTDRTFGELRERSPEWYETDVGAADAEVSITRAGVAGQRHYLMDLVVGYDKSSIALIRVCDGSTNNAIYEFHAHNSMHVEWDTAPLRAGIGNDLIVKMQAGSAGSVGSMSIAGFTA